MPTRDRAPWALAAVLSMLCLMAPAIWNRFPLLQWDTGDYIALWFEHALSINRGAVYGLFLDAGAGAGFWPAVVLQSAATVWVVALMLRVHGFGRPWLLTATVAVLSCLTTLPWLTSVLLTDIFCGLAVLATYLVLLRPDKIGRWETAGLLGLIAFSVASHGATLAVVAGLTLVAALLMRIGRRRIRPAGVLRAAGAIAFGVVLVLASNYLVAGKLAWTPGGSSVAFGRMLQDGLVKKYYDDHCPDPYLHLCRYKDRLPQDADEFFWHDPLFTQLGGFAALGPEMQRVALGATLDYPWLQVKTAAIATARQFAKVHTGEGVVNALWNTHRVIRVHVPQWVPAMRAARQYRAPTDPMFEHINLVHYPVALAGMALLPFILLLAAFDLLPAAIAELSMTCMLALLGNAVVCGVISNPHDRYGARIVWIAAFVALLALAQAVAQLRRARARPLGSAEPLFY